MKNGLWTRMTLTLGLCLLAGTASIAEDAKVDPSGKWTWTMPGRNGGPDRKSTLDLKVDGAKVTGKISSPGRDGQTTETEIADGKLKDGELSFSVTREWNGNKMTAKYNGKVAAEKITGKISIDRNGEAMTRDWEAKKEPAAAAK
jgi:hypothetical protein